MNINKKKNLIDFWQLLRFSSLCISKSMVVVCNVIVDNIISLIYLCKFYSRNLPRELNPKISEREGSKGEEVFGSTKQLANCPPGVDNDSHCIDYMNLSCPQIIILIVEPNIVEDVRM